MKQLRFQTVIFDLDGTLIDSAPGILACFGQVLREAGLSPTMPLDTALIGPPLRQTLMTITGLPPGDSIDELSVRFRDCYDSEGYKETLIYPGIGDMLSRLASRKVPMAIATNKRRAPTLKIVEHFGWKDYFRIVGTLDNPDVCHPDKTALIRSVLADCAASAARTPYIGDKPEDGHAAAANGMPFIAAGWGYGTWDRASLFPGWQLAGSPGEMMEILEHA